MYVEEALTITFLPTSMSLHGSELQDQQVRETNTTLSARGQAGVRGERESDHS